MAHARAFLSTAAALGDRAQVHGRIRNAGKSATRPDGGVRRREVEGSDLGPYPLARMDSGAAGAPRNRPSVLRSSSTSGQWMPYPALLVCQFRRCSGVASRSLGYQTRGTTIVRPSRRSTASVSSVKRTSLTLSPGLTGELCIPFLQQDAFVLLKHTLYPAQLDWTESQVLSQRHRPQPELC